MNNLFDALLTLQSEGGARRLQRAHLYTAITRLVQHLRDVLRTGDKVEFEGRTYALLQAEASNGERFYPFTVNNGRGPAMLGERVTNKSRIPFASYDEHIFFAENVENIVDLFATVLKQDTQRMELAESSVNVENIERIV